MGNAAVKKDIQISNDLNQIFEPGTIEFAIDYHKTTVILDLDKLRSINSEKIRLMVRWFREVEENKTLVLVKIKNARPSFIRQLVVLKNLIPENVVVESFYLVYICKQCFEEASVHVNIADLTKEQVAAQMPKCPDCGLDMEVEGDLDEYISLAGRK